MSAAAYPLQPHVVKLFDMREGIRPVHNVLGVGDPDVHMIDGRWHMFLGGFQRTFRNNLFSLRLPPGADLDSDEWSFDTHPENPRYAMPLADQPPRRAWDGYGLHEPCYVKGWVASPPSGAAERERIYYTGRSSRKPAGNTSPYAIGFLERTWRGWVRHPEPVITGSAARSSVVGPQVRYLAGAWRVWYCATWSALAARRLVSGRRPPVPAPFYFAVGRLRMATRL